MKIRLAGRQKIRAATQRMQRKKRLAGRQKIRAAAMGLHLPPPYIARLSCAHTNVLKPRTQHTCVFKATPFCFFIFLRHLVEKLRF